MRNFICPCEKGKHSLDEEENRAIIDIIDRLGENVQARDPETNITYLIPRIYVSKHGLNWSEVRQKGFRKL